MNRFLHKKTAVALLVNICLLSWSPQTFFFFNILLTCISSQILVNNQPDALIYVFIYSFYLFTCFEHQVLIINWSNYINTSSGRISLCKWLLGMPVRSSLLTGIPSSHLHRLIHTKWYINTIDLLMMITVLFETCREVKWINTLREVRQFVC